MLLEQFHVKERIICQIFSSFGFLIHGGSVYLSADTSDGPSPQKKERMQRRLDRIEKRQHKLETERKKKEQENLLLEQKEVEYVNCAVAENVHTPRYGRIFVFAPPTLPEIPV